MTTATMRLCDKTVELIDALGAAQLAVYGIDDDANRRALTFVVEKVRDIAEEIDGIAGRLHAGTPEADETA